MKIVYHMVDNDGRASAAIIYREFGLMAMMNENDFIGYDYNKGIVFPEITKEEPWYFVDIALNPETFAAMKACVEAGCKVYHIDHHRNEEVIDTMSNEDKAIMEQIVKFYDIRESATMLCWLYIHMPEEYRNDPMRMTYDFSDEYTHFIFNGDQGSEYAIPIGFRYVNDQDVRHDMFEDTRAFTAGIVNIQDQRITFTDYDSIHPMSKVWVELFRSNSRFIAKTISYGNQVIKLDEEIYEKLRETAFAKELTLDGETYNIIAIETDIHGSRVAGNLINDYDAYCRFNYDEEKEKYFYTFYSRENGKYLPCHLMCRSIDVNGGGHIHAAGCSSEKNIFEE